MLKRATDLLISATALILLCPVMAVVALLIRVRDGAPILYRGTRIGRYGKPFRMLKFRTMVTNAETLGGSATADTDPRITTFGSTLRKYKLDELPQVINVFLGHMSLVGPRPEVSEYVALLSEDERQILNVRPGLTDWATLWDRDEGALLARSPQPERMYLDFIRPHKVKLQLEYVRSQSFWIDLLILWKTIHAIIFRPVPPSLLHFNDCTLGASHTSCDCVSTGRPHPRGQ
jgi:lipopolysaccharide/colanic/teichoic acid biosynthesis glycosyltransferase